jgi:hypothetical protein
MGLIGKTVGLIVKRGAILRSGVGLIVKQHSGHVAPDEFSSIWRCRRLTMKPTRPQKAAPIVFCNLAVLYAQAHGPDRKSGVGLIVSSYG